MLLSLQRNQKDKDMKTLKCYNVTFVIPDKFSIRDNIQFTIPVLASNENSLLKKISAIINRFAHYSNGLYESVDTPASSAYFNYELSNEK